MNYSLDIVRRHDYDRYLASLFVRADKRPALWALYAFNHEIARTREVVTNTTLGLIRLQWWHDAFTAIYEGRAAPVHGILDDLAPAIKAYGLPKDAFERLLYAREFDLEDATPGNLQGLEHYADFTNTPLLELALRIAGEACGDMQALAQAYAMTGILRAVPFYARQQRCALPGDLLAMEKLTPEDIYAGRIDGLPRVVKAVAGRAHELLGAVQPRGRLGRVTAAQVRMRLRQIEKRDYNVFDGGLSQPPFYALRLLVA